MVHEIEGLLVYLTIQYVLQPFSNFFGGEGGWEHSHVIFSSQW